jgi:hypothetical protein
MRLWKRFFSLVTIGTLHPPVSVQQAGGGGFVNDLATCLDPP